MKIKQIKFFAFVVLLLIQTGCTLFGGKKSSLVVTSQGVLPPDTKMVGFNISMGPIGGMPTGTGQTFVFNITCPNVYQIAGLPTGSSSIGGTWSATLTVVSDGSPATQLHQPQFANGHLITCTAVLTSMSNLDGTNTVYTSDSKLTLILDPDQTHTATGGLSAPNNTALSLTTVPNLGMILPNSYTALYYYSQAGTTTNSYYITGAFARGTPSAKTDPNASLTCDLFDVNKDCYRNYVIGFVYSKSVTEAQNYLKNPAVSAAFQISEDPVLPPPENPELVLVQYPSDSAAGQFRYRMYGKALLENTSASTAGDPTAINNYFSPTPNSPIDDTSLQNSSGLFDTNAAQDSITNVITDYIRNFIFQFYYNIVPPSTAVDQFKNIVKNANSCKIFVIADSTNNWYNSHITVADPANSNSNLQTVPNTPVSGTPRPFIWDTSAHRTNDFPSIDQIPDAPASPTLNILNLNALMTVPSDGTNGVYDYTDLKDYYGKATSPSAIAANYTAAPGAIDTTDGNKAKIFISNLMLNSHDKLPTGAEASTPMKNQFFNWGIDDPANAPEGALTQTQSATYFPQLNQYKTLIVCRNQQITTVTKNSYTVVTVGSLVSNSSSSSGSVYTGSGTGDITIKDEDAGNTVSITGDPIVERTTTCRHITLQVTTTSTIGSTSTTTISNTTVDHFTLSSSDTGAPNSLLFYNSPSDCAAGSNAVTSTQLVNGVKDIYIRNTELENHTMTFTDTDKVGSPTDPNSVNIDFNTTQLAISRADDPWPYPVSLTKRTISATQNECKDLIISYYKIDGTVDTSNTDSINLSSTSPTLNFYDSLNDCNNDLSTIITKPLSSGTAHVFVKNTEIDSQFITIEDLSFSPNNSFTIPFNINAQSSTAGSEYISRYNYNLSGYLQTQFQITYTGGQYHLVNGCNLINAPTVVTFANPSSSNCSYVTSGSSCSPATTPCLTCSIENSSNSASLGGLVIKSTGSSFNLYATDSSFPSGPTGLTSSVTLGSCSVPQLPIGINSGISSSPTSDNPTSITTKTGMCTPVAIRAYNPSNYAFDSSQNITTNVILNDNNASNLKLYTTSDCSGSPITNTALNLTPSNADQGYVYVKSASDVSNVPLKFTHPVYSSLFNTVNVSTVSSTTPAALYNFIGNWDANSALGGNVSFTNVTPTSSSYNVSGILCSPGSGGNTLHCTYRNTGTCSDGFGATASAPCFDCLGTYGVYTYSGGQIFADFGSGPTTAVPPISTFPDQCTLDPG